MPLFDTLDSELAIVLEDTHANEIYGWYQPAKIHYTISMITV